MIDPPRIANLLSAGQHNLNYFVRKRKIKCVKKCVNTLLFLSKTYDHELYFFLQMATCIF